MRLSIPSTVAGERGTGVGTVSRPPRGLKQRVHRISGLREEWDDEHRAAAWYPSALNSVELWEIYNFTEYAHPIHIHEVQFQIEERQKFGDLPRPPESWERGFKDTAIAYPDEITRVRVLFDLPGLYVWHCHIVEHEDNEMMRPYFIGANSPAPRDSCASLSQQRRSRCPPL
jgi:FtsP/CotA-like multicopper oxidase with cupredoxin domain